MSERQSFAARVLLLITWLYAAVLGLLAVLWRLERPPWWAAVSSIFAAQWFWPLAVLIPLAARSRDWWLRLGVTLPGALFIGLFWRRFLPRPQPNVVGRRLRVATYNICFLNQNPAAVAAAICALDADIVALQELTPHIAAGIERELSERYPFRALLPAERQHGLGLLSRWPILASSHKPEYRGQHSLIDIEGVPLTLINVHPTIADIRWRTIIGKLSVLVGYGPGKRAGQIAALAQSLATTETDVVLAGDFNTSDREPMYRLIAQQVHDTFGEVGNGFGFTFPTNFRSGLLRLLRPLVRIDYIWYRGQLTPAQAQVVRANGGSDHCIVVADFVRR